VLTYLIQGVPTVTVQQ